jgi:LPXTG-motif cell wall-anchored protein
VAGNSTSDATPGSQSPVANTSTQAGQLSAKAAANSSTGSASTVAWLVAALAVAAAAIAGLALWRTKRRS